jgi:hypothetical protein
MHVAGSLNITDTFAMEEAEVVEEDIPLPQPTTIAPVTANATSINERKIGKRNSLFGLQLTCLLSLSIDMGPFDLVMRRYRMPIGMCSLTGNPISTMQDLRAWFCAFS